jgi:hypothetical protein
MNAKDAEKLMKALDDDTNDNLFNFTTKKIKEMNTKILNELYLSKKETSEILSKLKDYIYVDEMNELKYGTYIRWIPIEDPENIQLTKGAIFCELKITDDGIKCVCKNFGYINKHFKIDMDKNLIFRKLTSQELVLLAALDHLAN